MKIAGIVVVLVLGSCSSGGGGSNGLSVPNSAPAMTSLANGQPWSHQLQVAGADAPPQFVVNSGPAGLAVNATGLVTWTPSLASLGTNPVNLSVLDNDQTVSVQFCLRVHQDLLMGTAYSPKGHEGGVTTQAGVEYLLDRDYGRLVGYHTNWRDLGDTDGEIPQFALNGIAASNQFGVFPTFVLGWANGNGVPDLTSNAQPFNNSWTNAETRLDFVSMLESFAAQHEPRYLALANELNIWYATHVAQFPAWLSLYEEAYDAIKLVSPDTLVYATFQLEFLKGEGQGWPHGDTWTVFDQMAATGKLDIAAFTSYPYLEHATPLDVPANHYSEILMHWPNGPVAFTEIGWLSAPSATYPGSVPDQSSFVDDFFGLTAGLDLEFVQWLFVHDLDIEAMFPPFVGIGFRSNDGTLVRPSDQSWRDAVLLRER